VVEYTKFHGNDQVPFAVVNKNLMRFAGESTGRAKNVIGCDEKLEIQQATKLGLA
jgi:hypothetical protein